LNGGSCRLSYWRVTHKADPKFYTKSGRLTPYALACGYIEEKYYGPIWIRLWFEGGIVYHVSAYDTEAKERRFWESFDTLTEARRYYDHAEALCVAKKSA